MEVSKFNELEDKIKSFVEEYALLKERNTELEGLLKSVDEELGEAKHQIRILNEEKDAVRGKIDSMLGMFSDIKIP